MKLTKLLVHVLLTTASSVWLLRALGAGGGVETLNAVFVASLCLNWLMDYLGHRNGLRSPRTHEPVNASLLSAAVAAALCLAFCHSASYPPAVLISAGVGYSSHLLLDLASGGVYVREGDRFRRVRLARLSGPAYGAANSLLLLASLAALWLYLSLG